MPETRPYRDDLHRWHCCSTRNFPFCCAKNHWKFQSFLRFRWSIGEGWCLQWHQRKMWPQPSQARHLSPHFNLWVWEGLLPFTTHYFCMEPELKNDKSCNLPGFISHFSEMTGELWLLRSYWCEDRAMATHSRRFVLPGSNPDSNAVCLNDALLHVASAQVSSPTWGGDERPFTWSQVNSEVDGCNSAKHRQVVLLMELSKPLLWHVLLHATSNIHSYAI